MKKPNRNKSCGFLMLQKRKKTLVFCDYSVTRSAENIENFGFECKHSLNMLERFSDELDYDCDALPAFCLKH